ncbi:MAG: PIN domain-containing protein [Verrucomicrobiota bacterium]
MSAEYFLDTNILVYAFDQKSDEKRAKAINLSLTGEPWLISWQVVQEFCSVARHRFAVPLDFEFLGDYLELFLLPHCKVMPSGQIYQKALQIQRETQYRFYDSLMVAAALESGASILYSEDLQHDRTIGHLRIINPFLTVS